MARTSQAFSPSTATHFTLAHDTWQRPRDLIFPVMPASGLLERAAGLIPGHTYCVYADQQWNYAHMLRQSQLAAAMLMKFGVKPGMRVGILLPNIPEYIVAVNSIWQAGAIGVAISPLSVKAEVTELLKAVDCQYVISLDMLASLLQDSRDQLEQTFLVSLRPNMPAFEQMGYYFVRWQRTGHWRLPTTEHVHWFWDEVDQVAHNKPLKLPIVDPGAPAYILPTGGTTGEPKSVTLSHKNLVANAWQQANWAGASLGTETMLGVLPFFHSYGLSATVLSGAVLGASIILHHRFNVRRTVSLIEKYQPTVFHAVPAMLGAINAQLRARKSDMSSLRWVISGGAPLDESIGREFAEQSGALVVEGYGLSEASPVTHSGPLDGSSEYGTIGLPLPNTECRIVDPETGTEDVAEGDVGELIVRGPQVMLGYWEDVQATAVKIRDGWLYTGDLATKTQSGLYKIVERKKDLIITSGYNVYPREVERVLKECPFVQEVAVIGVPDREKGELVKAVIVLKKDAKWNEAALAEFCHQHLASHKRPRIFERCDGELPKNFLGKIVRRRLREPDAIQLPADLASKSAM